MLNLEKEIEEWKQLLDTGQIDQITYEEEVNRLIRKREKKKKRKKIDPLNLFKACSKIIIVLLICTMLIWIYNATNVTKNIEYITSLNNIQKPRQSKASGSVNKVVNGSNVEITYVAKYSISGRVVDVQDYYGFNIKNKLSPRDVGISWGFFAQEKNHKKVNWSSAGNRYLSWYSSDGLWISENGGTDKISEYFSNNHLIPSDKKIENQIKSIKENDFVKIDGYLVNVYCKKSNGSYFYWNSSTSRSDSGNGACEVIYVTNISWLELNK